MENQDAKDLLYGMLLALPLVLILILELGSRATAPGPALRPEQSLLGVRTVSGCGLTSCFVLPASWLDK
jgi:hypothetical protein